MAGVAQIRIYLRLAWQAWHSWHGVARLGVVWARGDAAPFCVAGVAQPYIHLRFTWQAWHKLASTFVSRGRRGAHGMGWRAWVWFGRAVTPRHFAWQASHNVTSTFVSRGSFVSRGRRGTNSHLPSFRAWHSWHGVARLGVVWARGDAAPFCVAGVAQRYIHLRFTWQAWRKFASTFVSRGRRGTHGMGWRAWVWFGRAVTPRHFAWQVWHKLTSTLLSRGRRGTHGMGWRAWVWFGRAVTPRHFAWQAWQNVTSTFVSRGRRGTN